jgi:hypothetical protein
MVRKLSASERNVVQLFKAAGFKVDRKAKIGDFVVPVLVAEKDNFCALFEFCYEDSEILVREHLVKWADRKNDINVDKIILVISGIEVLGEDRQMAAAHDIIIWEEANILELLNCIKDNNKEGTDKLLGELGIKTYTEESITSFSPTQDK